MATSALPGNGEHVLVHGDHEAIIVEAGAGVRSYTLDAVPVVAGYPPEAVCPSGRGQWLVPWPNRIPGGRYSFDGTEYVLPVQDPEPDHAIHGYARRTPFQVIDQNAASVELGAVLPARPGYPWDLQMLVSWELSATGLAATLRVLNLSGTDAPFGAGAHPYLAAGVGTTELIDAGSLTIPAQTCLTGTDGVLKDRKPVDAEDDFRQGRRIGTHTLGLYTDLARDSAGFARTLFVREDGWQVQVWQDEAYPFVLAYGADQVSDAEGRRASVAIEPMTCAVDAFNTGDGLLRLAPGAEFTGTWGITVHHLEGQA